MFEYAYYLDSLMFQMFKSKIISEKYIDENLFASLEKEYLKPNFPSDQNFQVYIKSNNNNSIVFNTSNNYQNYNYDLNNFNIDEISDENIIPNLNFKKKKKKIILNGLRRLKMQEKKQQKLRLNTRKRKKTVQYLMLQRQRKNTKMRNKRTNP